MFKWAQSNLPGFFNLRLWSCSSGLVRSLFERFDSRVSLAWLSLSEFKCTDVGKSIFCCWCQSNFVKNAEKVSTKTLTPLKFKCNLLSLRCLLESILSLSLCETNGIFLSAHINSKRLLTSVALLLRLSKRGTMPLLPGLVSLLSGGTLQLENTYSCILNVTGHIWESQKRIRIKIQLHPQLPPLFISLNQFQLI